MSVDRQHYVPTYYRSPAPHPTQMQRWTGAEMLSRIAVIWACSFLLFVFLLGL